MNFLAFWVVIGPTAYQIYVKKEPVTTKENPQEVEDTYVSILKRVHDRKVRQREARQGGELRDDQGSSQGITSEGAVLAKENTADPQTSTQDLDQIELPKNRITFQDYEAFLDKLEKDGRIDAIAENNPKEINFREE